MRAGLLSICFCLIPLTSQAAAIHDAAKKGDVAAIAAALDAGANVNDFDGLAAPLYYAVNRQHLDAAKLLIERGADVNAQSKIGGSPLMAAVARNQLEFISCCWRMAQIRTRPWGSKLPFMWRSSMAASTASRRWSKRAPM